MTTPQTLREGLDAYYQANPDFVRDRDLQLGWLTIPWRDSSATTSCTSSQDTVRP